MYGSICASLNNNKYLERIGIKRSTKLLSIKACLKLLPNG